MFWFCAKIWLRFCMKIPDFGIYNLTPDPTPYRLKFRIFLQLKLSYFSFSIVRGKGLDRSLTFLSKNRVCSGSGINFSWGVEEPISPGRRGAYAPHACKWQKMIDCGKYLVGSRRARRKSGKSMVGWLGGLSTSFNISTTYFALFFWNRITAFRTVSTTILAALLPEREPNYIPIPSLGVLHRVM